MRSAFPFDLWPRARNLARCFMDPTPASDLSFLARLRLAVACFSRALGSAAFCRQVDAALRPPPPAPAAQPAVQPPERVHAAGLAMLALLQREGRLIDFLQEDLAAFSDADVGAAARVVHAGCRKACTQHLTLAPVLEGAEGSAVTVPAGFDAQRIQLTGQVAGQPPFRGTLKHHGWAATEVRLPTVSAALDPRVLAPAEVEL
jgi:hypothetical protein